MGAKIIRWRRRNREWNLREFLECTNIWFYSFLVVKARLDFWFTSLIIIYVVLNHILFCYFEDLVKARDVMLMFNICWRMFDCYVNVWLKITNRLLSCRRIILLFFSLWFTSFPKIKIKMKRFVNIYCLISRENSVGQTSIIMVDKPNLANQYGL